MRSHILRRYLGRSVALAAAAVWSAAPLAAPQQNTQGSRAATPGAAPLTAAVTPPADYIIGPEDVLGVMFWRDESLSGDVVVRPDGKISIQLLDDVQAAGLTPEELRDRLQEEAQRIMEDPHATVIVKHINSRKVYITGTVQRPGPYPLTAPTSVLQLIAMAGGLAEWADGSDIVIMRTENGRTYSFRFNYKDIIKRRNLQQNIELKPGDTVIVP